MSFKHQLGWVMAVKRGKKICEEQSCLMTCNQAGGVDHWTLLFFLPSFPPSFVDLATWEEEKRGRRALQGVHVSRYTAVLPRLETEC